MAGGSVVETNVVSKYEGRLEIEELRTIKGKNASSTGDIGAGKAKSIALNHAGISASQVVFVKVEKEYDDGRL